MGGFSILCDQSLWPQNDGFGINSKHSDHLLHPSDKPQLHFTFQRFHVPGERRVQFYVY